MTRSRATTALLVGAVLALPLLAACGRGQSAVPRTSVANGTLQLSAGVATCAPSASERTCEVTVSYTNPSAASLQVDPGSTLLVDSLGDVHRGVARPELAAPVDVAAGGEVSIVWTTTVPDDALVTRVTYADGAGVASAVPVSSVVSALPAPVPSQPPAPEPVPATTPTRASPSPTKARPTPTPTRTRTRQPSPTPTSIGSIG